jgi:hypothetical protein
MTAHRLTLGVLVSLCALGGALGVGAPAQARFTHAYLPALSEKLSENVPAVGPHGETIALPGVRTDETSAVAIDSGHLWVYEDTPQFLDARIDEYEASTGAFLGQIPHTVGACCGQVISLAVGHPGGEGQLYASGQKGGHSLVSAYSEAGALQGTWTGAATPAGAFDATALGVAVDESGAPLDEHKGDVFVADPGEKVIDIFHAEADGHEHYVGQLTGVAPTEPFTEPNEVAVNQQNGALIVKDRQIIDVLEPVGLGEYVLAHRIGGTPSGPLNGLSLAVSAGSEDIYTTNRVNPTGPHGEALSSETDVDQFSPTGAYLGQFDGRATPRGGFGTVYAVAADEGHVYVTEHHGIPADFNGGRIDAFGPDIVLPDVTTEPPSSATPFTATLDGTVNPDEAGAATCRFEWGTSESFGNLAPCEPETVANGGSPAAVHANLTGLSPDTTYFYRLVASNANGTNPGEASQEQEFSTPGPGIREASVTNLASTSATFQASIDPHGAPATYYFQYGTTTGYGSDVPAPPGEAIGSGAGALDVPAHHVQGLQPATVYHYRVVVVSESKPGELSTFHGSDQTFVTQTAAVTELPDGRHWEMVSPPDKQGARIHPITEEGVLQAAAGGTAISYLTDLPTELEPEGFTNQAQVLSTRGPNGWTTRDIALPHSSAPGKSSGEGQEYKLFSNDLSLAIVQPFGNFDPELSSEASEPSAMLRTLGTGCAPGSCYRPLVTGKPGFANVPPGTVFGEATEGRCEGVLSCGPSFIYATSDLSHIVFGSASLDSSAGNSPFEWSDGQVTPLGVSPAGTPAEGFELGHGGNFRGAISSDGTRAILMSGDGQIFMRDVPLHQTLLLNAAEPKCAAEDRCQSDGGSFQLANAQGTRVVFTDDQPLTKHSGEVGQDLYECEMTQVGGELQCKLAVLAHEVLGHVLGAGDDGSYLYFVAESSLATGAIAGEPNLYVRHEGVTKLIALLSEGDGMDWSGEAPVRVSPDGKWLEFMSQKSLTGYDNRDAVSGELDGEVYLYSAASGRLACASCNPTGARPTGAEYFKLEPSNGGLTGGPRGLWSGWVAAIVPGWLRYGNGNAANQPRYLSNSGRLFFNSGDALVPQDVNGTQDVYEYEPPGVGDCTTASSTFGEKSGGCVALISAGTSAEESGFLEASEDGGDVFFLTYSKLAPQDYDASLDVYDAHECTVSAPCFAAAVPQPPACTTAEACRVAPTPQPALFGAPSSATFSGAGNVAPSSSGGAVRAKSLTRAQKLAAALRTCRRKTKKRKRAACARRARAQYGPAKPGKAATRKGNR